MNWVSMTAHTDAALAPLDDVRVVEICQGVVGPFCAMHLAAFGATVTKVEPPWGDWLREIPPIVDGVSALFEAVNRNKTGIRLDLAAPTAQDKVRALIATSDVVLIDQATSRRFPLLSYEAVGRENPRVVCAEAQSASAREDLANELATELTIQVATGVNRHLGRQGGGEVRSGFDIATLSTSMFLFSGIMAALRERETSGVGQRVSVSMLAAMTAMLEWNLVSEGSPDEWTGVQLESYTAPPAVGFVLRDSVAHVEFRGDIDGWRGFLIGTGRRDLADDPRFHTSSAMALDVADVKQQLAETLREWDYDHLFALVSKLGGTIVPILSGADALGLAETNGLFDGRAGDLVDQISRPWDFSIGQLPSSHSYEELDEH